MNIIKLLFLLLFFFVFSINCFAQYGINEQRLVDSKSSTVKSDESILHAEPEAKKQSDFTFSTNLYLWGLSLNGITALPVDRPNMTRTPELDISLDFSKAVENLKFAIMLGGKFNYKSMGLLYDISYVDLEFDGTVPSPSEYLNGTFSGKQFTGDFALLYQIPMKNKNVQISCLVGARVFSMDNLLDLRYMDNSIRTYEGTRTWADPVIGADTRVDLSKHWMLYLKGDAGGFGVSSNFTGSILWTIGYKFTKNWNTNIGFKYIYTDYEKDDFLWKMSQYGMLLSFGYRL
jgi:hypothetical protein